MQNSFLSLPIATICGILLALPFRTYDGSLPAWFALAPVFWLVARLENVRWASAVAAMFSFTWTFLSFTFLWHLTIPGLLALTLYTSLFYIVALLAVRRLARCGIVNAVLGSAALWALIEIVRATVPIFGFPWLLLGHTLLYNERLRQGADLLGVYGLSFIIVAVNALLAFALPAWLPERWHAVPGSGIKSAWKAVSVTTALLIGAIAYGEARITEIAPRLKPGAPIGIIQGNIIQKLDRTEDEMSAQLAGHLDMHRKLIQQSNQPLVLICWAETMVPGHMNADDWGQTFKREVAAAKIPTLAGSNYLVPEAPPDKPEATTFNAAYLLNDKGEEQFHYFKRKLVPFGEYIPFVQRFTVLKMLRSITRDQYIPGTEPSPVFEIGGYRIALNICVEDIHPDLAREAARAGADTLINITNDGWFYETFGPRAHLQAAAWRAVEVRRPLLRVTNTGRTVAVDPLGQIDLLVPHETAGSAIVSLKRLDRPNPQTLTMFLGDLGAAGVFIIVFTLAIGLRTMPPFPPLPVWERGRG